MTVIGAGTIADARSEPLFNPCEVDGRSDAAIVAVLGREEWKERFTNVRAA